MINASLRATAVQEACAKGGHVSAVYFAVPIHIRRAKSLRFGGGGVDKDRRQRLDIRDVHLIIGGHIPRLSRRTKVALVPDPIPIAVELRGIGM